MAKKKVTRKASKKKTAKKTVKKVVKKSVRKPVRNKRASKVLKMRFDKPAKEQVPMETEEVPQEVTPTFAKKRVVIAGGTGFIGRHVTAELTSRGYHVIILSHNSVVEQKSEDGTTTVSWDGKEHEKLIPYVDGASGIINLAGEKIHTRWSKKKKEAIRQSRIDAGHALLQAVIAVQTKPHVFIQASAVSYYSSSQESFDESGPNGSGFLASVCNDWEGATADVTKYSVRHIVARFGSVLGKDGGELPRIIESFRVLVGGPAGGGAQAVSWIHITDCVNALCFLLEEKATSDVYNICSPEVATNRSLHEGIGRRIHLPALFSPSGFMARLFLGEMAKEVIFASHSIRPVRLLGAGFVFRYTTLDSALDDLLKA